jgi:hypothetical protein
VAYYRVSFQHSAGMAKNNRDETQYNENQNGHLPEHADDLVYNLKYRM